MDWLCFAPQYQERVWGGRGLATHLGRDLPEGPPIGESWEIVDRPEANSVVAAGPFAGKTLEQLREEHTADLMGPEWPAGRPFPILVKWLDCQERLSLQVHPPADIAPDLGGEPKTENWYIAHHEPGAALLAGLVPGVSRDQFAAALDNDELEPLVGRLEVHPGDSLFVPSGRIHAIDAGNLILEIQQNSDTTYRVYDWGRVGLDGKPRQLHIEESLKAIHFDDAAPELLHTAGVAAMTLADSKEFRLRKLTLAAGGRLRYAAGEQPRLLGVVAGALQCTQSGETLSAGANVLLPFACNASFETEEGAEVLVTEAFHHPL